MLVVPAAAEHRARALPAQIPCLALTGTRFLASRLEARTSLVQMAARPWLRVESDLLLLLLPFSICNWPAPAADLLLLLSLLLPLCLLYPLPLLLLLRLLLLPLLTSAYKLSFHAAAAPRFFGAVLAAKPRPKVLAICFGAACVNNRRKSQTKSDTKSSRKGRGSSKGIRRGGSRREGAEGVGEGAEEPN